MVDTIGPLVQVDKRLAVKAFFAHSAGSMIAASALGSWLGLVGAAFLTPAGGVARAVTLGVLVAVAAAYSLSELNVLRVPLIERRRQVPESWRRRTDVSLALFFYGLILGSGVLTYVATPLIYLAVGVAFVSASPLTGGVIGLSFGVSRLIPIAAGISRSAERSLDPDATLRWGLAYVPYQLIGGLILAATSVILVQSM